MNKEEKNYKGHSSAHQNPNSTWVCGEAHSGAHKNPDGTLVLAVLIAVLTKIQWHLGMCIAQLCTKPLFKRPPNGAP